MKKILTVGLIMAGIMQVSGQESFRAFIDSAFSITDSAARVAFVEEMVNHLDTAGAPLVEADTAHFIYYGKADTVVIAGDFNGWGSPVWACERIPFTDFFSYSHSFEPDARLDYKFILNGTNWILDPLNPHTVSGGYGPNSELAMQDYIQPWEIQSYDGVAKGTIESFSLQSTEIDKNFTIQVYLPPGYSENSSLYYPVVYVHDGHEYIGLGSMNNVIDNLIDSNKIDPVIGVFIRPINRNIEYMGEERNGYAQFIVQTVVPYIDDNYRTIRSKDYRLTMGPSLGGNISGLIAYNYPAVIANSGWHSPALWVNGGEVAAMYLEEAREVKIYFNVGTYEDLGIDWDDFTSGLTELGYTFRWDVLHEGHSWGQWRATTDDILEFFFPAGAAPLTIECPAGGDFSAGPGFPNPFSDAAIIPLAIERPGKYFVEIYNQTGQLVNSATYQFSTGGEYTIEIQGSGLRSGIYHVLIHNQKHILSQKIRVH